MQDGGPIVKAQPKRPFGRSLSDFRIEGAATPNGLHPAEEKLLDCAYRGEECRIALTRPDETTLENTVRGSFLRFLLLGGDDVAPVHEKGVILRGSIIEASIDFEGAGAAKPLALKKCKLTGGFIGSRARILSLDLSGSAVGFIKCDSTRIIGDVHLSYGFEAMGEVNFSGSHIGGQLICDGGLFNNEDGYALYCENARFNGSVFLRDGFTANGEVNFRRTEIAGALGCDGGTFTTKKIFKRNSRFAGVAIDLGEAKISKNLWFGSGKGGGFPLLMVL